MADGKNTKLSIVLGLVDKATSKLKAVNARVEAATKPIRDFKEQLSDLRKNSGIDDVIGGFQGVGSAVVGILAKVAMIGGAVGAAVAGVFKLVDGFDELGDKAEAMGVSVDFLAQLRYAAERSGASVETLDSGLKGFTTGLGQARAGTGKMLAFLTKVDPALARGVKGAKSNEEAFGLLADAMNRLEDPAKRAALAQKTFGDSDLAPLLAKGSKGIQELRDRYFGLAGSQEDAAKAAGEVDDSLKDLKASTDGAKASIVKGLAPALKIIVEKLAQWFTAHRADIADWAAQIGEKLPGAVQRVVEWIGKAYDKVSAFVERIGGLKTVAIAVAAIIVGPLLAALVSLGSALVTAGTAMSGLFASSRVAGFIGQLKSATTSMLGLGGATSKTGALTSALGRVALPIAIATTVNELTGGSFEDQARAKGFEGKDGDLFGSLKHLYNESKNRPDATTQLRGAFDAGQAQQKAKILIELVNAPPRTRVTTDPSSTADVQTNAGYLMAGAQ